MLLLPDSDGLGLLKIIGKLSQQAVSSPTFGKAPLKRYGQNDRKPSQQVGLSVYCHFTILES
jgi:hypothetical protein